MTKYIVERTRDNFEPVTADTVHINAGSLIFTNGEDATSVDLVVAFAPGQWETVIEDTEETR